MSVVDNVSRRVDDDSDPTWDEAVASFEAATPVKVVRPPRRIRVVYRYADRIFTATSPDLTDFEISGPSLYETTELVKQDLAGFLDPAVEVIHYYPAPEPNIVTSASRSRFNTAELPAAIIVTSLSAGRAFISSARASLRRVRA